MDQNKEPRTETYKAPKREAPQDAAAPPDAAGHAGSFTRPSDVMTPTPSGNGHAPSPDTHRRDVEAPHPSPAWNAVAISVAVLVLLGLVYFFVAG